MTSSDASLLRLVTLNEAAACARCAARVFPPWIATLGVLILLAPAAPASAQAGAATPDKGVIGYGIDAGVLFPDDTFENTLAIEGHGEYYLAPGLALRGILGFANPGVNQRTEDRLRQVKLSGDVVYNWRYKQWRPFVSGGIGAYFVRLLLDGRSDPEGEVRGGLNFGGGTEFVLDERSALKSEVRWDIVSQPPGLSDATGAALLFGYKRYF
jgi:hypothetical protein